MDTLYNKRIFIILQYLSCVLVHNADNATLSERAQLLTSCEKNHCRSGMECNN